MDLTSLNREELKNLLKKLKTFKNLRSSLGKRGDEQFKHLEDGTPILTVEHTSKVSSSLAYEKALEVFKKAFKLEPKQEDIKFVVNDNLVGGIRVIKDDSLVDLSFLKIENALTK
ncbi:MAG: hypothetical protein N4A38_05765 [Candidatus Gracilibacteria bacterium]|jgi:hypothetical protein|nr:hypothetical protein [Candidatus Gracilibacteria bacterium]